MKHMSLNTLSCLLLAVVLFSVSCSKEGPAGPQGEPGPAGPAGTAGNKGDKGDPGTANVIYSGWLDVTFKPDTTTLGGTIPLDTVGFYADINANKLDNAILSSGEIKVYVNANTAADPQVHPLPYLDIYSGLNITASFSLNTISLYSNGNVGTITDGGQKYQQYRYILIPGGTAARSAKIDWNNYAAVKAYLKLKD